MEAEIVGRNIVRREVCEIKAAEFPERSITITE